MDNISLAQYQLVYNALSFGIAVMGAATVFLFLNRSQVASAYKTAISISGLVTLIAMYHYLRIFNSWGLGIHRSQRRREAHRRGVR